MVFETKFNVYKITKNTQKKQMLNIIHKFTFNTFLLTIKYFDSAQSLRVVFVILHVLFVCLRILLIYHKFSMIFIPSIDGNVKKV